MTISFVPQGQEPERHPDYPYNVHQGEVPYTSSNPKVIDVEEALELTLEDYGLTADAIKAYMFGLTVEDPNTGEEMPDSFYLHTIENAISLAEQNLDIAIFPRIETEFHDFRSPEFRSYMHTQVYKRPVIQIEELHLEAQGRPITSIPPEAWNVYHLIGHVAVSPSGLGVTQGYNPTLVNRLMPHTESRAYGMNTYPQFIKVTYLAGLLPRERGTHNRAWEAPATLEKYILKIATKEIIQMWGKLLTQPGLAGSTLTMDGITETRTTTASAMYSTVSADLNQIDDDIKALEEGLKSYFGSSNMISV